MATKAAKQILRKEIKRRVAQLSENEKLRQSNIVTNMLLQRPEYKQSERVCVYLSMHDEVKTEGLLQDIFTSHKQCFIPRYIGSNMEMVKLYSMDDYHGLPETSWKIKQPLEDDNREQAMENGGLDLILMPGLGFSLAGDRLGRGKGYYDTYLDRYEQKFSKKPCTIALAFYEQICASIPTSEHDIPVDLVLHEAKDS